MMRISTFSLLLLSMLTLTPCTMQGKAIRRADILEAMERANTHFIVSHPDPTLPTCVGRMRPSNLWTRGVYFEGLTELIRIEQQTGGSQLDRNMKYLTDWADFHQWTPRNGVKTRDADDYCCCQTYLVFANEDGLIPTRQCMDNLLGTPESEGDWTWIDAIQMGLPVLIQLSRIDHANGDPDFARYAEQGWRMYQWTRNTQGGGLFNEAEGLWWRDKDFVPPYKEPNGKHCYWSRGNGWVYAALVRAMENIRGMQGYDNHLKDYEHDFRLMSEALAKCIRKDYTWNVSLHDQSNYGGMELTGTALFVYGMAWGIRNGLLNAKKYTKIIDGAWSALTEKCLHPDGTLGYVQGTGKQPSDSQPVGYNHIPDFDDFGLGCFLLAGSEMYRLKK